MIIWHFLRRHWLSLALLFILGLVAAAYQGWQVFRAAQGLAPLEWQGLQLSHTGLSLQRLSLQQQQPDGTQARLDLTAVQLSWPGLFQGLSLKVARLDLSYQPAESAIAASLTERPIALPSLTELSTWLGWLPAHLEIERLHLDLPCATGRCQEQMRLSWQSQAGQQQLALQLYPNDHEVALNAQLSEEDNQALQLALHIALDGQQRLQAQQQMRQQSGSQHWVGSLAMGSLPEAPWLLEWLSRWLAYEPVRISAATAEMRLGASWALEHSTDAGSALQGEVRAALHLPTAWPIPGLGPVQGQVELALTRQAQRWLPTTLALDVTLQPEPSLLKGWPVGVHPGHFRLKVDAGTPDAEGRLLPLRASLTSQGNLRLNLQLPELQLGLQPLALSFKNARLDLNVPRLQMAGYQLKNANLKAQWDGQLSEQQVRLNLHDSSQLSISQLQAPEQLGLVLQQLHLQWKGLQVQRQALEGLQLQGHSSLKIGQIQHPALKALGWVWQGQLSTDPQGALHLDGNLNNSAGLGADLQLTQQRNGQRHVSLSSHALQLKNGNPLAASLSDWPALLELDQGSLQLKAQLKQSAQGQTETEASLGIQDLSGLYDRTEWQGLNAALSLQQRRTGWLLEIANLQLERANPGIALGPLAFKGRYQFAPDAIQKGHLSWQTATLGLLGGQLWADPGQWALDQSTQPLHLQLRGLDVAQLLAAYPAQHLAGTGLLDGNLELQANPQGLRVERGSLSARAPGTLQLQSPGIQALGASNPAMQLVAQALENFHYSLLASDVRYDPSGQLQLGLRLQGRNPALEGGRPIHFSINLEENLPALLTSLQVSGRVTERLQQRVQEQLKGRTSPSPSVGD